MILVCSNCYQLLLSSESEERSSHFENDFTFPNAWHSKQALFLDPLAKTVVSPTKIRQSCILPPHTQNRSFRATKAIVADLPSLSSQERETAHLLSVVSFPEEPTH